MEAPLIISSKTVVGGGSLTKFKFEFLLYTGMSMWKEGGDRSWVGVTLIPLFSALSYYTCFIFNFWNYSSRNES